MALKPCEGGTGSDTKFIFATGRSFLLKINKEKKNYEHASFSLEINNNKEHRLVQRIRTLSADFLKTFSVSLLLICLT